ncbi:unnamed protein product [Eretmochelys imbricata]
MITALPLPQAGAGRTQLDLHMQSVAWSAQLPAPGSPRDPPLRTGALLHPPCLAPAAPPNSSQLSPSCRSDWLLCPGRQDSGEGSQSDAGGGGGPSPDPRCPSPPHPTSAMGAPLGHPEPREGQGRDRCVGERG